VSAHSLALPSSSPARQHGIPRVTADEDKSEETKQKEQQKIKQYRELAEQVNSQVFHPFSSTRKLGTSLREADRVAQIKNKEYTTDTLALTSKLLMQNPEYYTIWNHRRLILQKQFEESNTEDATDTAETKGELSAKQANIKNTLISDLQFLIPLMLKFPKCYWMWNHRLWLLTQATKRLPIPVARRFWQDELGLVGKMLGKDSRNFHGWGYRRHLISQLEAPELSEDGKTTSLAEEEFAYTTKMIRSNLSNFSAWHYRGKLMPRLLDERNATKEERMKLLDSEFKLIQEALYTDPADQSLWKYHQFLMWTLGPDRSNASVIVTNLTNHDRLELYEREINNIKEMVDPDEECKWIYQALLQYNAEYLEFDAGNKLVSTMEMREWLEELRKLDPLRKGRWDDLEKKLNL
jgi:geranylgeranyl transferase type-2 subunit alpha